MKQAEEPSLPNDMADDTLANCSTGNRLPDSGSRRSLCRFIVGKRIPRPIHNVAVNERRNTYYGLTATLNF